MAVHTVVIGAGVIGLATAYRLARAGAAVTVVDASDGETGASVHNAGWVTPILSAPVPAPGMVGKALRWMLRRDSPLRVRPVPRPEHVRFMVAMLRHCNVRDFNRGLLALMRLNERTIELLDRYEQDGVRFESHSPGQLMAFHAFETRREYQHAMAPLERIGHTAEQLTGDELRDLEPALGGHARAGLLCPRERHLDPVSLVKGLKDRCRDLGVRFVFDSPVEAVTFRGTEAVSVLAGGAAIDGDRFVLAVGARTGRLARLAGFALPVQPGKGYGFDDTSGAVGLRHSVYLGEAKVAVTPLSDRLRFAGTMEFGSWGDGIDRHRLGGIVRSAREFLPEFPADAPRAAWSGLRPMTPDGLPVIGRLPGRDNVFVAGGHGMFGVTLSPVTAEIIAAQIEGGKAAEDVAAVAEPFTPLRFAPKRP